MRLVTWNCNRGSVKTKLPLLDCFEPTIAILPECAPATEVTSCLWLGDSGGPGIAVNATADYRITPIAPRDVPRYTFPIQVEGPVRFLLLVVWSRKNTDYRYVKAVIRAVECYSDLISAQPTVLIGDFNSNTRWDYKRRLDQSHSGLVRRLSALHMTSAYHSFFGEAHGAETRSTLYLLKQKQRSYHIDYCFIPNAWLSLVRSVELGKYEDWIKFSDHTPLCVDIDLSGEAMANCRRIQS
jgi:exodeoxyribonuclease III